MCTIAPWLCILVRAASRSERAWDDKLIDTRHTPHTLRLVSSSNIELLSFLDAFHSSPSLSRPHHAAQGSTHRAQGRGARHTRKLPPRRAQPVRRRVPAPSGHFQDRSGQVLRQRHGERPLPCAVYRRQPAPQLRRDHLQPAAQAHGPRARAPALTPAVLAQPPFPEAVEPPLRAEGRCGA